MVRTFSYLAFLLGALLTVGLGVYVAKEESSVAANASTDSIARLSTLPRISDSVGISVRSQNARLNDCYNGLYGYDSLAMRYAGQDARERIVNGCAELAAQIVSDEPTQSLAWLISAMAASRSGDWTKMNHDLSISHLTGSGEQRLAVRRVALAEQNFDKLSPKTVASHRLDLAMLIGSRLGVASIARRYVANRSFRERITAIVETLPTADQYRFLNNIKREYGLPRT